MHTFCVRMHVLLRASSGWLVVVRQLPPVVGGKPQPNGVRLPTFDRYCLHCTVGTACLYFVGIASARSTWSQRAVTQPNVRQVPAGKLDNRELDKLVGALGRSRATWRRALLLHEWLLGLGHAPDDRLCTTLIRVCAQHGQVRRCSWCCAWTVATQGLCFCVDWQRGFFLCFMLCELCLSAEAHLACSLRESNVSQGRLESKLSTGLLGSQALSALNIYDWMRARVKEGGAGLCPTVFTYTAAMRAALSAGLVDRALKARNFLGYYRLYCSTRSWTSHRFCRCAKLAEGAVNGTPLHVPLLTEVCLCRLGWPT